MSTEKQKKNIKPTEADHIFTEYACDCGTSWSKKLGPRCPDCGTVKKVS